MYDKTVITELPLSASHLPSNLSLVAINDKVYAGIIHRGEFIIVCLSLTKNNVINRVMPKLPIQQMILQATWIWAESPLLVIATTGAVHVFDWDGAILIHTHYMPSTSVQNGLSFFRGIVGLPSGRICVGMHSGEILILNLKDSNNLAIVEENTLRWFPRAVAAMASNGKRFVAADVEGNIVMGSDEEVLQKIVSIGSCRFAISCIEIFQDVIIAGYISGHIRIFDHLNGKLKVEVCAHAKAVYGIDIARATGMLLSISEDSFARIWRLDLNSKTLIEHKHNHCETNTMLCGGRFKDDTGSEFLLTGYDVPRIISYIM